MRNIWVRTILGVVVPVVAAIFVSDRIAYGRHNDSQWSYFIAGLLFFAVYFSLRSIVRWWQKREHAA